uniref:Small ribosomal subunit protein uS4c n=1 Tax=Rhizochromulina marina TaxID=1034831 RepID=A0A514CPY8_9STRA|nr:ribosomal protein S4 [Rhizochromulina marina]QDH81865.1 ribosomal protein S4 [Rhizochromulina marina]
MSRYRGPKIRLIRKLGELPGLTTKTTTRFYPPGQHGPGKLSKKSSLSEYGLRLQEKQKLRYNYGVSEQQLLNYVKEARRLPGATGSLLLQLLEMRLDNIVFRLGFAPTIPAARQFVSHGSILVNGRRVDIPSFQCQVNDVISVKDKPKACSVAKQNLQALRTRVPSHLEVDVENLKGKVISVVVRDEVNIPINELLIVEFYSRK